MESAHKIAIEESEQSAKGKVFRLGEWGRFDLPDPYKQDLSMFVKSFNLIELRCSAMGEKNCSFTTMFNGELINFFSPRSSTHDTAFEAINLCESKSY